MAKPKPGPQGQQIIKSTVAFPEELWDRAKRLALTERTDFRSVVVAALEAYLVKKKA